MLHFRITSRSCVTFNLTLSSSIQCSSSSSRSSKMSSFKHPPRRQQQQVHGIVGKPNLLWCLRCGVEGLPREACGRCSLTPKPRHAHGLCFVSFGVGDCRINREAKPYGVAKSAGKSLQAMAHLSRTSGLLYSTDTPAKSSNIATPSPNVAINPSQGSKLGKGISFLERLKAGV